MDIVARADGAANAGGALGGGGVEITGVTLAPASITITAPRIEDTSGVGTTIMSVARSPICLAV